MAQDENHEAVAQNLYLIERNDPDSVLLDRTGVPASEQQQIGRIMAALGQLREAEQRLTEASATYMSLGQRDMRALHYLIVAEHSGAIITPGAIAAHLRISTASTTKLLDRLERAGHILRAPHPHDRRALAISITPETKEAAMLTVGRVQARRFHAAARLAPSEREIVIKFLDDMAAEISLGDADWVREQ